MKDTNKYKTRAKKSEKHLENVKLFCIFVL